MRAVKMLQSTGRRSVSRMDYLMDRFEFFNHLCLPPCFPFPFPNTPSKSCQSLILHFVFQYTASPKPFFKWNLTTDRLSERKKMVAAEKTVNTINILHSKPKQMATDLEIPYWKIWHPLQSDHSAQSSDWGLRLSPGCTPSKH